MSSVTFEFTLPKGNGELLGNAIRRLAMTSIPSWRPIAFGFEGMQMNMLHIDSLIMEDTPAVLANLSDLQIIPTRDIAGPYKIVKFMFRGELTADVMSQSTPDFRFVRSSATPIVSAIDRVKPITLTVIFKLASGGFTSKQNTVSSDDVGIPLEGFVFLGSRHAEVDNFTYDIVDAGVREERLIINVSSNSKNPKDILDSSAQSLENLLSIFRQNLNQLSV